MREELIQRHEFPRQKETYFDESESHRTSVYETCATQHKVGELPARRVPGRLRDAVTLKTAISAAVVTHSVNTTESLRRGTTKSCEGEEGRGGYGG